MYTQLPTCVCICVFILTLAYNTFYQISYKDCNWLGRTFLIEVMNPTYLLTIRPGN